ncbi:putative disease resistance protein [Senna tora]|uniref:Putative disease resistance protein n=1 Tax=Senna tora TaxID=362788 RepID=A0A834XCX9_9FABA|nr:putative disease resistance protein [Senna tora]
MTLGAKNELTSEPHQRKIRIKAKRPENEEVREEHFLRLQALKMVIAETLGASALGPAVGFGIKEPYKIISSRVASSKSLEYNYDMLEQNLQRLLAIQEDNERQVWEHKHKDTSMVYRSWKNRLSSISELVDQLRAEYKRKRLPKWRFIRRSTLSEKILKRNYQVRGLIEEGIPINILVDRPPARVLKVSDAPKIKGYPTLEGVFKEILSCVNNKKVKVIGVYGRKGVGKTTILQNLNNDEVVSDMFDIVIFIKVPADHDVHKLQQTIAERLKINDIEAIKKCTDEVARRIHEELRNKKYLLILDGVADSINLKHLGILMDGNGSKVIMASQFFDVCNKNNADRLIKVRRLETQDEAWEMFRDTVGPVVDRPNISRIAERVSDRCSRLPLLINKIANSFKLKSDAACWEASLEYLDEQWGEYQNEGIEELYSFFTFCYDQLKDEQKKCFLYTSLYPANSKVYTEYLVECWAAQGFLGDVNERRSYRKACNRGRLILRELVNVSLLEKGDRMKYVTLDDCMRKLALQILSKHSHYTSYVTSEEECEKPLRLSRSWKSAKWVSLIDTRLCDLPTTEDCSMLETLLLQRNSELATIPETFFQNARNLLLLDLYKTSIKELPSSLSKLIGLKGLYLNDCKQLSELPPGLTSLQLLEVLDIRGSQVGLMSSCVGSLANLRCLRIRYIEIGNKNDREDKKHANYDVISKLQNLEELIIEVISYQQWHNQVEKVIEQVALLQRLTTFSCSFPSSKILRNFLAKKERMRDHKKLTSFHFFIGCPYSKCPMILQCFEDELTKYLRYCNGEKHDVALGDVLCEADALELVSHKDITNLSDLGIENMNNIRGVLIEECKKISTIVDGEKIDTRNQSILLNLEQLYLRNLPELEYVFRGPFLLKTFMNLHTLELENCLGLKSIFNHGICTRQVSILPNLEKLKLKNMPELTCIFSGPIHPNSFSKLQILALENCSSLRSIFNIEEVTRNFSELRILEIRDCLKIEEVIVVTTEEDMERAENVLPTLEKIELADLPNLQFICKRQMLAWSSLELLKVHQCPKLKSLPFHKDKAAKLRSIKEVCDIRATDFTGAYIHSMIFYPYNCRWVFESHVLEIVSQFVEQKRLLALSLSKAQALPISEAHHLRFQQPREVLQNLNSFGLLVPEVCLARWYEFRCISQSENHEYAANFLSQDIWKFCTQMTQELEAALSSDIQRRIGMK